MGRIRLNERAVQALFWADSFGLYPDTFVEADQFVDTLGYIHTMRKANPKVVAWMPTFEVMQKILQDKFHAALSQRVLEHGIVLVTLDAKARKFEGAGSAVQEALLSLLETLKDAYNSGDAERNRSRDSHAV